MAAAVLALALPAFSQVPCGQAAAPCRVQPPRQPYSAEFRITRVQTLANGTTITHVTTESRARDSQNRIMNSNTATQGSAGQPTFTFFNVYDPTDHSNAHWDNRTKTARITKMPAPGCRSSAPDTAVNSASVVPPRNQPAGVVGSVFGVASASSIPGRPAREMKREDLGTSTIMGVEARGARFTQSIPTGEIGNDQPLERITERWNAPSLGLALREVIDDPRMGKTTREVVNLSLSEPDPATFQPPEGYEVVTETMPQMPCQ
jgi:hypothetical protein